MKRVDGLISGEAHRNLKRGLLPCLDLQPTDGVPEGSQLRPWGNCLDYVSVIRFPPGVAGILRARIATHFEKLSGLNNNVEPVPLGLRITPTAREDFRYFKVDVDINDEADVKMIRLWHPYVEAAVLPGSTLQLHGLLTELPTTLEAYKSMDQDLLFKCCNIAQLMVVCFPEDEAKTFPTDISRPNVEHVCVEQYKNKLSNRSELNESVLQVSRCPWLANSGITPPTTSHREKKSRDTSLASKAEIRACEMAMLSILKRGRLEWAELDVHSALQAFMLEEAIKPGTTVPNAQSVLVNNEQRIVKVIGEQSANIFDDAASDLSDQLFGDDPALDDKHFLESDKIAVKRRKDHRKLTSVEQEVTQDDHAGRLQLEQEFNELAESAVKQSILEQEIEEDFFGGSLLEEQE